MKRWAVIISDKEGLDAVIQLSDDPGEAIRRSKELKALSKDQKEKRATIVHLFEHGSVPSGYNLETAVKTYVKKAEAEITKDTGGSAMGEYAMFDLRSRYVSGNVLTVSVVMTEQEMKAARSGNPYESALDILKRVKSGKGNVIRGGDEDDVDDFIKVIKIRIDRQERKK